MSAHVVLAVLGLIQYASADFGSAFSTGPVADNTFIREATSTLVVPAGNQPFQGFASLWVGMGTSNGDLVQAICDRHPGNGGTPCEDITSDGGWCGYAYTLEHTGYQAFGNAQASVNPGDHFEMKYVYNDGTQQYDQYAIINGQTVSTLSTSSGHAQGWGTAVECAANDCGTVPAHTWINTVLTFDVPDPNYGNTAGTNNANTSGFYTPDGGKTWMVDTIYIGQSQFGT